MEPMTKTVDISNLTFSAKQKRKNKQKQIKKHARLILSSWVWPLCRAVRILRLTIAVSACFFQVFSTKSEID